MSHKPPRPLRALALVLYAVACCFALRGPAFAANDLGLRVGGISPGSAIPKRYTCEGTNISPALRWSAPPPGTKSFAIVVADPDAPGSTAANPFVHWIVYDIRAKDRSLSEHVAQRERLTNRARQGVNSFGSIGYGGPCPPNGGPHRYVFALFALDTMAGSPSHLRYPGLIDAMKGHVLAKSSVTAHYR